MLELSFCPPAVAAEAEISDNAVKCACRFFDRRLLHGCAVIDYACAPGIEGTRAVPAQTPKRHAEADTVGRVLRQCVAEPITMTEMSRRLERTALLQKIASLDLRVLEEGVRGGLVLRRMPLTESRKALLDSLGVPLDRFQPEMQGAGRFQQHPVQNGGLPLPATPTTGRVQELNPHTLSAALTGRLELQICRAADWAWAGRAPQALSALFPASSGLWPAVYGPRCHSPACALDLCWRTLHASSLSTDFYEIPCLR